MGRRSKKPQHSDNHPHKKVKTNDWQEDKRGNKDIYINSFANDMFKRFYERQLLDVYFKGDQLEFNQFWEALSAPLPVTFRVNPTQHNYQSLIDRIKTGNLAKELVTVQELKPEHVIQPIPWYPNNLAWETKLGKKELRKALQLSGLHQFIQKCNSTGLLTRQEAVSMLPPLFLDPKPGDYVLDMCAAPGSKTCQMLEMMDGGKGVLVANDVDQKRAYMLSHQLKRMATSPVVITNHAAQFFPTMQIHGKRILFDKILCDVPCTGDGAARKLPTRWMNWSGRDGNAIHPLQLSILMRALNLCKVGGLVLYSTCSLNPIEDEAVVTEIFRRVQKDSLELIELNTIPNLKTREGLTNWKVLTTDDILYKEHQAYNSDKAKHTVEHPDQPFTEDSFFESLTPDDYLYEAMNCDNIPSINKVIDRLSRKQTAKYASQLQGVRPSLFPNDEEFMNKIGIKKTIRVLPHDQDTGGFYLALFRKKTSLLWTKPNYSENILGPEKFKNQQAQQQQKQTEQVEEDQNEKLIKDIVIDQKDLERVLNQQQEEPQEQHKIKQKEHHGDQEEYKMIHDLDYKVLKEYFGLSEDFPQDQLLCATVGNDPILNPSKKFRFITKEVKNLLEHDPQSIKLYVNILEHLKILNLGCKIIERGKESFGGSVAPFRIAQEGLSYIMPYMTRRIVDSSLDSFLFLIEKKNIKEEQLLDTELLEKVRKTGHGCFVLRSGNDSVVCQYFRNSISLMCSGEQSENFLIRHGRM